MSTASLLSPVEEVETRTGAIDWRRVGVELDESGNAVLPALLSAEECDTLARLYPADEPFRTRIVMARHGFGRGEYKYFADPLPHIASRLDLRAVQALGPSPR